MRIAIAYTLFAVIATVANIAAQDLAIRLYAGPYALMLSILVGTGTGLVTKYVLDKRYIFSYRAPSRTEDSLTFVLYTLTGVLTTAIFWGAELGFDALFETRAMRYLGGVAGLALGYALKYRLDKRFVFPADREGARVVVEGLFDPQMNANERK